MLPANSLEQLLFRITGLLCSSVGKDSVVQCKYSVTKIELLAIVETLKEFKGMLWGQPITVFTDTKIS
jgi:hypothetical protein